MYVFTLLVLLRFVFLFGWKLSSGVMRKPKIRVKNVGQVSIRKLFRVHFLIQHGTFTSSHNSG